MASQSSGVLLGGDPPPPLSTEPMKVWVTSRGWMLPFSTCVIWPIFSARVISASRAATRWSTPSAGATGVLAAGGAVGVTALLHAASRRAASRVRSVCFMGVVGWVGISQRMKNSEWGRGGRGGGGGLPPCSAVLTMAEHYPPFVVLHPLWYLRHHSLFFIRCGISDTIRCSSFAVVSPTPFVALHSLWYLRHHSLFFIRCGIPPARHHPPTAAVTRTSASPAAGSGATSPVTGWPSTISATPLPGPARRTLMW